MHIFIQNRFFILVWQVKLVDFLNSQFYTSVNLHWQYCCIVLLTTCDTYLELTTRYVETIAYFGTYPQSAMYTHGTMDR